MSTELANTNKLINVVPAMAADDVDDLTVSKFLPRIQLFTYNSKLVQRRRIDPGHFALVVGTDNFLDIGEEFDCVVVNFRPKAMDLNGEVPVAVFDKSSPQFKDIAARAAETNSNCMYGREFLLWLPSQGKFATMFFGNPTMRREAPMLVELHGQAATIRSREIEKGKYSWHGPQVIECTTPITNLPDSEKIQEENTKFITPPESAIEEVDTKDEDADRER